MTTTRKQNRKPNRTSLRSLDAAELRAVTGGIIGILSGAIIIYGSTSVGDGLSTSFTGGVAEALPAVQR